MNCGKPDDPERFRYETATMGCRTRVFENRFGERLPSVGKSFFLDDKHCTSGYRMYGYFRTGRKNPDIFLEVDELLELTALQLHRRFEFQKTARAKQFPLLMSSLWVGAEKLKPEDTIEVL